MSIRVFSIAGLKSKTLEKVRMAHGELGHDDLPHRGALNAGTQNEFTRLQHAGNEHASSGAIGAMMMRQLKVGMKSSFAYMKLKWAQACQTIFWQNWIDENSQHDVAEIHNCTYPFNDSSLPLWYWAVDPINRGLIEHGVNTSFRRERVADVRLDWLSAARRVRFPLADGTILYNDTFQTNDVAPLRVQIQPTQSSSIIDVPGTTHIQGRGTVVGLQESEPTFYQICAGLRSKKNAQTVGGSDKCLQPHEWDVDGLGKGHLQPTHSGHSYEQLYPMCAYMRGGEALCKCFCGIS